MKGDMAVYVTHMGESRSQNSILVRKLKVRDLLEDLGIDWRILL
jgi:hypothetical protein